MASAASTIPGSVATFCSCSSDRSSTDRLEQLVVGEDACRHAHVGACARRDLPGHLVDAPELSRGTHHATRPASHNAYLDPPTSIAINIPLHIGPCPRDDENATFPDASTRRAARLDKVGARVAPLLRPHHDSAQDRHAHHGVFQHPSSRSELLGRDGRRGSRGRACAAAVEAGNDPRCSRLDRPVRVRRRDQGRSPHIERSRRRPFHHPRPRLFTEGTPLRTRSRARRSTTSSFCGLTARRGPARRPRRLTSHPHAFPRR